MKKDGETLQINITVYTGLFGDFKRSIKEHLDREEAENRPYSEQDASRIADEYNHQLEWMKAVLKEHANSPNRELVFREWRSFAAWVEKLEEKYKSPLALRTYDSIIALIRGIHDDFPESIKP